MSTPPEEQTPVVIGDFASIPFKVYGHDYLFASDPTNEAHGDAWVELMQLRDKLADAKPEDGEAVKALQADLKRMLGAFIVKGKTDWDKAGFGFLTLAQVLYAYVQKVNDGIPTVA
jgi:hypothetical protein